MPVEPKPRQKVVVRKLPPSLPEAVFWEAAAEAYPPERVTWKCFVPGKASSRTVRHARAYLAFRSPEDVFAFKEKFDGHAFVNERGAPFRATIEYAPSQRLPGRGRRDGREGTLEKDADFQAFCKALEEAQKGVKAGPGDADKATAGPVEGATGGPVITSLMQAIINKHTPAARLKAPLLRASRHASSTHGASTTLTSAKSAQAKPGKEGKAKKGKGSKKADAVEAEEAAAAPVPLVKIKQKPALASKSGGSKIAAAKGQDLGPVGGQAGRGGSHEQRGGKGSGKRLSSEDSAKRAAANATATARGGGGRPANTKDGIPAHAQDAAVAVQSGTSDGSGRPPSVKGGKEANADGGKKARGRIGVASTKAAAAALPQQIHDAAESSEQQGKKKGAGRDAADKKAGDRSRGGQQHAKERPPKEMKVAKRGDSSNGGDGGSSARAPTPSLQPSTAKGPVSAAQETRPPREAGRPARVREGFQVYQPKRVGRLADEGGGGNT